MTMNTSQALDHIDIHELLTSRRQVAIVWNIEDVQAVRPDLTDEQSWEVLKRCIRIHDCEVGFTWHLIHVVADDLFPTRSNANEETMV